MEGTSAQNRRKRPLKKVFHWIHWHLLFLNNMMLFVGTHALSESRILEISFKVPVSHSWNNFKINCFGAWPVISQRTIQPSGIKGKKYIYIFCVEIRVLFTKCIQKVLVCDVIKFWKGGNYIHEEIHPYAVKMWACELHRTATWDYCYMYRLNLNSSKKSNPNSLFWKLCS